ncbi:hypothetical protein ACFL0H_00435 [Thermodesulfobacteriota bacterium]
MTTDFGSTPGTSKALDVCKLSLRNPVAVNGSAVSKIPPTSPVEGQMMP